MKRSLPALLLATTLAACSTPTPTPAPAAMPGSDRDAHGCIGSAGYSWCAHTQQCERPWELAKAKGLANTATAIDAWCAQPPATGTAPPRP